VFSLAAPDEPQVSGAEVTKTSHWAQRRNVKPWATGAVRTDYAHADRVSLLGELTASIAHEVNQPLAAIAASGQAGLRWLGRPAPDLAEVRELIERIVADARRAADVIARVRSMAVRKTPEQALCSLDDVIDEALLLLRHEVQSRGVSIAHHPGPGEPRVLGDRTQLQQVIVNLAVNSMQAMANEGSAIRRIIIRTATPDAGIVSCSVEDSGPGIGREHLGRLFESFFTTKEDGMGMGLPICRSIIEAHGGRLTADNDSAEGGARCSFTLPAVAN
jgi:C4-dicarboxylate-specific signal transduction histidine kinase